MAETTQWHLRQQQPGNPIVFMGKGGEVIEKLGNLPEIILFKA